MTTNSSYKNGPRDRCNSISLGNHVVVSSVHVCYRMISWLSEQINSLSPPKDGGPHAATKTVMKEVLACDAVLTPAKELEYKFLLEQVCRATFDVDDRIIVMDFLHYSMAPVDAGREWRTVFNGLRVLSALIDSGSGAIFSEVAEGKHFDVVQKTLFLLTYAHSDERIGKLIRTAAKEIRDRLLQKFEQVGNPELPAPKQSITSISSKEVSRPQPKVPSSISHVVSLRHSEGSSDDEPDDSVISRSVMATETLIDVDESVRVVPSGNRLELGGGATPDGNLIDVEGPSSPVKPIEPLVELL